MKMSEQTWRGVEHFTKNERWGDPSMMDANAVFLADFLREQMGAPFVIHCAYDRSGHTPSSQHYYGRAVDGHFVDVPFGLAVDKVVNIVENSTVAMVRLMHPGFFPVVDGDTKIGDLIGLGIYPHWNNPGLHLDTRGYVARWGAKYIWIACPSCHGSGVALEGTNLTCAKCGGTGKIRKQEYVTFEEAYQLIK